MFSSLFGCGFCLAKGSNIEMEAALNLLRPPIAEIGLRGLLEAITNVVQLGDTDRPIENTIGRWIVSQKH